MWEQEKEAELSDMFTSSSRCLPSSPPQTGNDLVVTNKHCKYQQSLEREVIGCNLECHESGTNIERETIYEIVKVDVKGKTQGKQTGDTKGQ